MSKLFLIIGGTYLSEDDSYAFSNYGKGGISVSNVEYERKLISGFESNGYNYIFISAPNVGIFPKTSKKAIVKNFKENSRFRTVKYNNFYGYSHVSKYVALKKEIKNIIKCHKDDCIHVICTEMHLPYLKCVKFIKEKCNNIFSTLIIPDLPENMTRSNNFMYRFLKKKNVEKIYSIVNQCVDSFVPFTEGINRAINIREKPYTLSEGLVFDNLSSNYVVNDDAVKHCVFVGKTNRMNGVDLIIKAAKLNNDKNIVFDVYGTGELTDELNKSAKEIPSLNYFGHIPPSDVREILSKADILLSPRIPGDFYQRYSFPSKILDYICFYKPIITFDILSYFDEIKKYLLFPDEISAEGILKCINKIAKKELNCTLERESFLKKYSPNDLVQKIKNMNK